MTQVVPRSGEGAKRSGGRLRAAAWIAAVSGSLILVVAVAWPTRAPADDRALGRRAGPDRLPAASARARDLASTRSGRGSDPAGGPSRTITGRILDDEGEPVTAAAIEVFCEGDASPSAHAVASVDEEGAFIVEGCAAKSCLRLRATSHVQAAPWEVIAPAHAEFVVGARDQLVGVVVDPRGAAIEAARVSLIEDVERGDHRTPSTPHAALVGGPPRISSATTDEDGRFQLPREASRICDACEAETDACGQEHARHDAPRVGLRVVAEGMSTWEGEVRVRPGGAPIEVHLADGGAPITGRLTGAGGGTFPRAHVLARATVAGAGHPTLSAQVAGDGTFALAGAGGERYELRALQDGRELARREATAGEALEWNLDTDAQGVELALVLSDGRGLPCVGASVEGGPFVRVRADARGQVRATAVLPGAYALTITRDDDTVVRRRIDVDEGSDVVWVRLICRDGD